MSDGLPGSDTPAGETAAARIVEREVRDFVRSHEQRRRQLPRAIVIGLFAGLVAVAFRGSLNAVEPVRTRLVHALVDAFGTPGFAVVVSFATAGGALVLMLVTALAPETSGSGIPHVKAVLHNLAPMRWLRVLVVKFSSGVVGIGSGLVLGREGPTIQMGAAVGEMVSRMFASSPRERRTLVAAGAGAGLSAAFNAPLAGLVFVLEEAQRDFAPAVFAMALLASAVGDVTTRIILGQLPVFHVEVATTPPLTALPTAIAIGVVAGFLGVAFNRGLVASLEVYQSLSPRRPWLRGAVAGACVGAIGCVLPETLGSGNRLVEAMLDGTMALAAVPLVFVVRFGLTMISYGSGAAGGIFAPLLVLGAAIGLGIGGIASHLGAARPE